MFVIVYCLFSFMGSLVLIVVCCLLILWFILIDAWYFCVIIAFMLFIVLFCCCDCGACDTGVVGFMVIVLFGLVCLFL